MKFFVAIATILLVANVAQAKKSQGEWARRNNSQVLQNKIADRENLSRIANDAELNAFKKSGLLVPILVNEYVRVDTRKVLENGKWKDMFPEHLRYVRPWVNDFLQELGKKYYAKFGEALQVNSAVRTERYQRILRQKNKNAASVYGPKRSTHMTGATVDIGHLEMSPPEFTWMNIQLARLKSLRQLEFIRETAQACFHVMKPEKLIPDGMRHGDKKYKAKKASRVLKRGRSHRA